MMILTDSAGGKPESVLCGPESDLCPESAKYEVTIYNGTDCKLCDVVREGELLGRRRRTLRGQPWIAAKGNGMSGGRVASKAGGRLLALSVIVLGAALALFGSADRAGAADRRGSSSGVFVSEMNDVQRVKVIVNKSRTFRVDTAFSTIVTGSPDIADVKSLSDHLIYIQGKQTGTTNVILFDSSMKQIGILDVEVAIDTGNLQQQASAANPVDRHPRHPCHGHARARWY